MDLNEEKKLIREAKQNPEVFGRLYDEFYQPIFSYILRRTADIELAQDLTSQTFFKALKNLKKFRWQNVPIAAWFYRIADNEVNGFWRKQKKVIQINIDKIPEIPSTDNADKEIELAEKELKNKHDFLRLHKCIVRLQPIYQTVIVLRFFDKKKISEICQILGKKEGTVKSQLHRGVQELKKLMEA